MWNSPVTGEFPTQRASNAENISIWWRHHAILIYIFVMAVSVINDANAFVTSLKSHEISEYFLSLIWYEVLRHPTVQWRPNFSPFIYGAEMNIDGLVHDCSIFISNALEILQSCTKPSIYFDRTVNKFKPIIHLKRNERRHLHIKCILWNYLFFASHNIYTFISNKNVITQTITQLTIGWPDNGLKLLWKLGEL